MPRGAAVLIAATLAALPAGAAARSSPGTKIIPRNVLLYYYSRAPGAGEMVVRFSGAAKVIRSGHRTRSFRLDAADLRELRGRLRSTRAGFVHAADRHDRDAVFQLHRPRRRVRPFPRELLAFGHRRFAGHKLPEVSAGQQRLLDYLDGIVRSH
jgi:hypothetical protein